MADFSRLDPRANWKARQDEKAIAEAHEANVRALESAKRAAVFQNPPPAYDDTPRLGPSDAERSKRAGEKALQERTQAAIAAERERRGLGPGEADAQDMAAGTVAQGAQIFDEAIADLQASDRVTGPRPGHVPTKRYTTKMGTTEKPGLVQEAGDIARQRADAEMALRRQETIALEEEAARQRDIEVDMRAAQFARAERLQEIQRRQQRAYAVTQKTTQDLMKLQDVDPNQAWAKKPLVAKIFAGIGAALRGALGMDPMGFINGVIDEEMEAWKANRDLRAQRASQAQAQFDQATQIYNTAAAEFEYQNQQDAALRLIKLQQVKATTLAMLSAAGEQVHSAEQSALINGLDQEIAKLTHQIELTEEANTPMVTRVVPRVQGDVRGLVKEKAKTGLGMVESGTKDATQIAKDRQTQARDLGFKQTELDAKAKAGPDAAQRRVDFTQMQYLSNETKLARKRLRMIQRFRKKYGTSADSGDIPGVSWADMFVKRLPRGLITQAARDARAELKRIYLSRLREETGAAYNTKEEEDVAENYVDGFGEQDVFHELARQEEDDVGQVKDIARAVEPDVAARWFGTTTEMLPYPQEDLTGLQTQAEAEQSVAFDDEE